MRSIPGLSAQTPHAVTRPIARHGVVPAAANRLRDPCVSPGRMFARCALAIVLTCAALDANAQTAVDPSAATRRPKIGLVLSGGGARGITHVGVLQVLEEMRVPVDFVAATSMGSIVGGLYASGMPPGEMQHLITTIDWTTLFSDSPPRRELTFRDKQVDTRFPLPLEIGFRDWQFRGFQGALSGANLELFLHELTAKADGVRDFDRLPIPFRAVSTDMVTGTPYVFDTGPLYEAMRASMSIPGVFSPVELRGRLLGDGGLVDNLPVDVVRRMGADIVIAVNIGTPLMNREQLSSIVGLTGQMINILTEQNVRAQLASLRPDDVLISPDLGALSAVDFTKGPEFIRLGDAAARAAAPKLAPFALPPAAYAAWKAALPKIADTPPPRIEFVRIEGTQLRQSRNSRVEARRADRRAARHQVPRRGHLPSLRHGGVRADRLPHRRCGGARRPRRRRAEGDGAELSPVRPRLLDRLPGRNQLLAAGRPSARLGQQPRRAVDQQQRDRARPHRPRATSSTSRSIPRRTCSCRPTVPRRTFRATFSPARSASPNTAWKPTPQGSTSVCRSEIRATCASVRSTRSSRVRRRSRVPGLPDHAPDRRGRASARAFGATRRRRLFPHRGLRSNLDVSWRAHSARRVGIPTK